MTYHLVLRGKFASWAMAVGNGRVPRLGAMAVSKFMGSICSLIGLPMSILLALYQMGWSLTISAEIMLVLIQPILKQ